MVKVESYSKQKFLYSFRSADGSHDLLFSNIKSFVRWFGSQSLFPSHIVADYDRIVRTLRSDKPYMMSFNGGMYELKQLPVVGMVVKSAKRVLDGSEPAVKHKRVRVKRDLPPSELELFQSKIGHRFKLKPQYHAKHWHVVWDDHQSMWACFERLSLMQFFKNGNDARKYVDIKSGLVKDSKAQLDKLIKSGRVG